MASRGTAEEKRLKAQAHFAKAEERQREATKAYGEVQLKKEAEVAKTVRLRELRLAKEAADELTAKTQRAEKEALAAASSAKAKLKKATTA
jgi:hypothetical protein